MIDYPLPDAYYRFRPLKRRKRGPSMSGWDVYALQTALNGVGANDLLLDGVFGIKTHRAVREYQSRRLLVVDGIAGGQTQRSLALDYIADYNQVYDLPDGVPYGHVERESGFILGNHTTLYPNGSRDIGVAQLNTAYLPVGEEHSKGFNVPYAISALALRVRDYHDKYVSWGVEENRAWRLACGAWNAPAWTDTLARGGTLSPANYEWIANYIEHVTAYADLD